MMDTFTKNYKTKRKINIKLGDLVRTADQKKIFF